MMSPYTHEQYEQALRDKTQPGQPLPGFMRWSVGNRTGKRDRLIEAWPTMSLEDRISQTAVHIGLPVYGTSPTAIISTGYALLCRHGTLTP